MLLTSLDGSPAGGYVQNQCAVRGLAGRRVAKKMEKRESAGRHARVQQVGYGVGLAVGDRDRHERTGGCGLRPGGCTSSEGTDLKGYEHALDVGLVTAESNWNAYNIRFFCRNCWCRRGIKSAGSGPTIWFFIHYNFVRTHMALGGCTPAQAAGISTHGPDKWWTITGNAALAAWAVP